MTDGDAIEALAALTPMFDRITTSIEAGELAAIVDAWADCNTLITELATRRDAAATIAASILDRVGATEYSSPTGTVVHLNRRSTDRVDGRALLSALAVSHVDADTGEIVDVVPIDTLADVIPAIDGTSSKWRATGLAKHGIVFDRYRDREWKTPTIAKGPRR